MSIKVWDRHMNLLDLLALDLDVITIEDIAHTLSQINRWGGRSPWPYTVARHSVDVYRVAHDAGAHRRLMREALLHDIAEAFTGDVVAPLKRELPVYNTIEALVRSQLAPKFGLPITESPEIAVWDRRARAIEREILFQSPPEARYRTTPEQDRACFLKHFYELT